MSAQVYYFSGQTEMWNKPFLERTNMDLFSKLSLTCGSNVNHYKSAHHPIRTLHVGTGNTLAIFKTNKLYFQLSVQIFFFLSNLKRRWRPFLEGARNGGGVVHWEIIPRALGCLKRWKSLFFCKIWSNPTPLLFLTRPPYKKAIQRMKLYDKFVDRFQDLSKVQNPAISKAKV